MATYVLNTVPKAKLPPVSEEPLSDGEREARLERAINYQIAQGSKLANQGKFEAVMISGRKINHILHLLLAVFTLGLWLIIWAIMGIFGGESQYTLGVDEYGKVTRFS